MATLLVAISPVPLARLLSGSSRSRSPRVALAWQVSPASSSSRAALASSSSRYLSGTLFVATPGSCEPSYRIPLGGALLDDALRGDPSGALLRELSDELSRGASLRSRRALASSNSQVALARIPLLRYLSGTDFVATLSLANSSFQLFPGDARHGDALHGDLSSAFLCELLDEPNFF